MLALKRLVTILVMVYLLLTLLFVFSSATRDTFASAFNLSGPDGLATFYNTLFLVGAGLLALQLITENMDSALLRRETAALNGKINELKAKLYDHQIDQRERDFQQRTVATTTAAPVAPASTTVYQSAPVAPTPVYIDSAIPPTAGGPATLGHEADHPNAVNAPTQYPQSSIPPASAADLDNRPTL